MKNLPSKPKNVSAHAWAKHLKLTAKLRAQGLIK
jgi:hypothetical protein